MSSASLARRRSGCLLIETAFSRRPNPSILSVLIDYAESAYLAGFFLLQLCVSGFPQCLTTPTSR